VLALAAVPAVGVGITTALRQGDAWLARRSIFSALANGPYRPLEARLSYAAAAGHRPPGTAGRIPGAGPPRLLSMQALGRLERGGDGHGVAVANLMVGELAQARVRLDEMLEAGPGRSLAVLNDRAAVAIAEEDHAGALELLDEILARDGRHGPALFNRALALRNLRLTFGAAVMFERLAALAEPGWAAEARAESRRLHAHNAERLARSQGAELTRKTLARTRRAPDPSLVSADPEMVRSGLYDAVWTAGSAAEVAGLLPLARALDQHFGGDSLRRLCDRARAADFSRRRPLAERHVAYAAGKLRGDELVAFALAHQNDPAVADQVLGALAATGLVKDHLDSFNRLAASYDDPWLATVEQEGRWARAHGARHYDEAARTAAAALASCNRAPLHRRCLTFESRLAQSLSALYRLPEARSHLRHARELAIGKGLLRLESTLAASEGKLELRRFRSALGRAFLEEVTLNAESRCFDQSEAREKLAEYALSRGRLADAAQELARMQPCPRWPALSPAGISVAAALRRLDARLIDPARVEAGIRQIASIGGPESRGYHRLVAGRWRLNDDPEQGTRLLREALDNAPSTSAVDRPYVEIEARAALAFEAGRRGRWAESLDWLVAAAEVTAPASCALGVAVDLERALFLARGPAGAIDGRHLRQATAAQPVDFERASLDAPEIPEALREHLAGCREIAVVTLARQRRWTRLLGRDVVWSYAARPREAQAPVAQPPAAGWARLVVSDPRPPASLMLGRLAAVAAEPGPREVYLRALEATPGDVLARLPHVDLVELHVHGMVDADVSQHTALVLSPDARGDFLLSREELDGVKLPRGPVVVLAACETARLATRRPDASELATAFMRAGSRAVVATTGTIPDGQGERFFRDLRREIERGVPAARALRDVRLRWGEGTGASWTDDVIAYD
jgi:cellulose synthase operon protein C